MASPGWTIRVIFKRTPAVLVAGLAIGCSPAPDTLESGDPAGRMHAAAEAAEKGTTSAVPDLVEMLSSDDPAERLVAIGALERLTGQRLGYDPTAVAASRQAAINRWEKWLARQDGAVPVKAAVPGAAETAPGGVPGDPATVTPRTPRTDR